MDSTMKPVIRSLTLKGFRGFAAERLELDNPTFLVGQNGAGKSTLVGAFALIAEAMTSPLPVVVARRGGIQALCHRSPASDTPGFGLAVKLQLPGEEPAIADYAFEVEALHQKGFQVKRERCSIVGSDGQTSYFERGEDELHGTLVASSFKGVPPLVEPDSLGLPLVGGHKAFAPVVQALSAMRAYSIEPWRLREVQDPNGAANLKPDGSNAASILSSITRESPRDVEEINEFLATLLPQKVEVRPIEVGNKLWLELTEEWEGGNKITLGASSMSDGTLRSLGLLLAVFQKPTPTLILFEEPEATIHPGALDTILDVIKIASYRSQAVVTTHSPELLDSAKWIEDRHLRVVYRENGVSHVTTVGKGTREALREHLMGAGEMLRSNLLDIPLTRKAEEP